MEKFDVFAQDTGHTSLCVHSCIAGSQRPSPPMRQMKWRVAELRTGIARVLANTTGLLYQPSPALSLLGTSCL